MKNALKIAVASGIGLAVGFAIGYSIKKAVTQKEEENSGLDNEQKEELQAKAQEKAAKKEQVKEKPKPQLVPTEPPKEESPIEKEVSTEVIQLPLKDDSFPLEYGSSGARVERLQVYLMRKLGWVGKPSGVFDGNTLLRVQQCFKGTSIDKATYERLLLDKMVHDQHKAA